VNTHPKDTAEPSRDHGEPPQEFRTLGKYRILSLLGQGGMSRVYKAYQPGLDRYVAIKVIHAHLVAMEGFVERFEREAAAAARLRHPNIVRVYDFDSEGDQHYMVMELIEGPTLKKKIAERHAMGETFSLPEAARIFSALGSAIDAAHARGIVHRDLKPANVMFTAEGQVVLTDFGIARVLDATSYTVSGSLSGTPAYMSPEQVQGGRGDARSDIYALGVILYEMLAGQVPFSADNTFGVMFKHVQEPVPPPTTIVPDLPAAVERVILKAMDKNPDERYQAAGEMTRALWEAVPALAPTTTQAWTTDLPAAVSAAMPAERGERVRPARVFISYKRDLEPDEPLAMLLRAALEEAGHSVFIDRKIQVGVAWATELERQIEACDYMLVLLSEASVHSEMVAKEVECAYRNHQRTGRSRILPVRLNYADALPYQISHYLDHLQYIEWHSEADDEPLIRQLLNAVANLEPLPSSERKPLSIGQGQATTGPRPYADPRFIESLRDPSGAVGIHSQFYIEREGDERLMRELAKPYGTTTTIRAPRQTGKSSLLVRGIAQAKAQGSRVVFIDLQPVADTYLRNLEDFLRYFATVVVAKLRLDPAEVEKAWRGSLGAPDKTTYLMEGYVLPEMQTKLVLAIDEADRLLRTTFHDSFFGLIRFWHNSRAMDDLWENLDMVMVISTEPHLLIGDVTQSPFNVGLRIRLQDFDEAQVRELNRRYRSPLEERHVPDLLDFLNGHPYLTHKALYLMLTEGMTWDQLTQVATTSKSPFGDHLQRYLWLLRDQPQLRTALKQVISHNQCPDEVSYYRLFQAGLIKGRGREACACRCKLYETYLKDKL